MIITIPILDSFLEELQYIKTKLESFDKTDSDKWLTNDEFCKLLNISHKTAQSYRDKGYVTFSQIGNKIHYRMSAVNEFLDSNSKGGQSHGKSSKRI